MAPRTLIGLWTFSYFQRGTTDALEGICYVRICFVRICARLKLVQIGRYREVLVIYFASRLQRRCPGWDSVCRHLANCSEYTTADISACMQKQCIRDTGSTADISSTFNHFQPLSSSFIHFHPLSSTFIHFHSLSFTFIHFHPLSTTFTHFHPLSSTFVHFHPRSPTFIPFI